MASPMPDKDKPGRSAASTAPARPILGNVSRAGETSAAYRPRTRRSVQQAALCSGLVVDLLQLLIIPSVHQSRQLALRAHCAVQVAVPSPSAAKGAAAASWSDGAQAAHFAAGGGSGVVSAPVPRESGTPSLLLPSLSPSPPLPSRPGLYIDAYDQWVVRNYPCQ